ISELLALIAPRNQRRAARPARAAGVFVVLPAVPGGGLRCLNGDGAGEDRAPASQGPLGIMWEGEGEAGVAGGGRAGGRGRGGVAGWEPDFGAYQIVGVPVCLLVGWSFIGCGPIAWQQRRGERVGAGVVFIWVAWFAAFIFAPLRLPPAAPAHPRGPPGRDLPVAPATPPPP